MVAKKGKVRKRNPNDATLRNIRAANKRLAILERRVNLIMIKLNLRIEGPQ